MPNATVATTTFIYPVLNLVRVYVFYLLVSAEWYILVLRQVEFVMKLKTSNIILLVLAYTRIPLHLSM